MGNNDKLEHVFQEICRRVRPLRSVFSSTWVDEYEKTNILKGVVDAIAISGLDPVSAEEPTE